MLVSAGRGGWWGVAWRAGCGLALTSWLRTAGYIGDFEIVDDHRAGKVVVSLLGACARAY